MSVERNIETEGIVINVCRFGEMDKLITLFTPQFGAINVVIFGGRKGKQSSLVSLFSYGLFKLYFNPVKKKYSLIDANCTFVAEKIKSDLYSTYTASCFCEMLLTAPTDEPDKMYRIIIQAINILENNTALYKKILVDFSWKYLQINGIASTLTVCPNCERQLATDEFMLFSTSLLTPVCKDCANTDRLVLTPGCRRYLLYTMDMSLPNAFDVKIFEKTENLLLKFLTDWILQFTQKKIKSLAFINL